MVSEARFSTPSACLAAPIPSVISIMTQNYTYVYFDENFIPYYVGKGIRNRDRRRHAVPVPPLERVLRFDHNSAQEAFDHEHFLVTSIGRKDLGAGPLMNLTDGGAGCKNPTASARSRMVDGGRISGLIPKNYVGMGQAGGRQHVASGHWQTMHSVGGKVGGKVTGRKNAQSGLLDKARHIHWHVNRNIVKASCSLCQISGGIQ